MRFVHGPLQEGLTASGWVPADPLAWLTEPSGGTLRARPGSEGSRSARRRRPVRSETGKVSSRRLADPVEAAATGGAVGRAARTSMVDRPTRPAGRPPAWYPDPSGRFAQRYWNGVAWTEFVAGPHGGAPGRDPGVAIVAAVAAPG